jgi:hypothetical protein
LQVRAPAGANQSPIADLQAITMPEKQRTKLLVIGLLSGFSILLDKVSGDLRTNPAQFIGIRIRGFVTIHRRNAFPNMNPVDKPKLTKRNAAALAKYAGLVGLTPEKFLNRF